MFFKNLVLFKISLVFILIHWKVKLKPIGACLWMYGWISANYNPPYHSIIKLKKAQLIISLRQIPIMKVQQQQKEKAVNW